MNTSRVTIYDTTLRDGTQGTGISFSVLDKIRVAEKLDDFGVHYIEGGWPGSNPKDAAFFEEAAKRKWKNARVTAFGMTRRGRIKVEDDAQVQMLLDAKTPAVTIVGKTWPLHVTEVFQVSLEENLAMISDTVAYLKKHGREVLYDAEHFSIRSAKTRSTLATIKAAQEPARISSCSANKWRLAAGMDRSGHQAGGCGLLAVASAFTPRRLRLRGRQCHRCGPRRRRAGARDDQRLR